jgi:peroxiredoxin
VVAISVDPPEVSAKLKEDLHLPFPLLSDRGGAVIKAYGLIHEGGGWDPPDISRPAEILLDASGIVRWVAFPESINVRTHPEAILAAAATID